MEDVREECTMQNIVTEIETMFCDEEYGFEVYALIKGDEKTLSALRSMKKVKTIKIISKTKFRKQLLRL